MKIAVVPNLSRECAHSIAVEVCRRLNSLGIQVIMQDTMKSDFADMGGVEWLCYNEAIDTCDAVIAIGGDGTILHTAHDAALKNKAILGINAGRLAFMAGLEQQELELLQKLVDSDYHIDKRMMLNASIYDGEDLLFSSVCLNDAVIARGNCPNLCDVTIFRDGQKIAEYYADGVVFATPTGSTAYSLAAGGPVIEPTIESIVLTPICAHSLAVRPIIISHDSVLEVKVHSRGEPMLSCDGVATIPLKYTHRIIISKADVSAQFIKIKSDSFMDVVAKKLSSVN